MTELLKVYRFQFKKREPILVAALSYPEAFESLAHSEYHADSDDEIECISIFNNLQILV